MTMRMIAGAAVAALMLAPLPALALFDPDNPNGCGGEVCITGGGSGRSADSMRPEPRQGGPMIRNNGRGAMDPTRNGEGRRSERARPATVNAESGDECVPPYCDGLPN